MHVFFSTQLQKKMYTTQCRNDYEDAPGSEGRELRQMCQTILLSSQTCFFVLWLLQLFMFGRLLCFKTSCTVHVHLEVCEERNELWPFLSLESWMLHTFTLLPNPSLACTAAELNMSVWYYMYMYLLKILNGLTVVKKYSTFCC